MEPCRIINSGEDAVPGDAHICGSFSIPSPLFFKNILSFVCTAAIIAATGCASRSFYGKINASSADNRYEDALSEIETNRDRYYPKNDTLLYFLDKGMLSHLAGKYKKSNTAFEKAKKLAEKLYTKSLSAESMSLLTNDSQKPYDGEDYETGMIYLIKALNYAALGDEEGALVEIRQLNHFFKTISSKRGTSASDIIKPGALYFAGMIRESAADINGSLIDYKNALRAFKKTGVTAPKGLINSCYAAAVKMGFRSEARRLEKKYALKKNGITPSGKSEIIIVHLNGPAPVKRGRKIEVSFGEGWAYAKSIKTNSSDSR
ncbi:MAG: hypothetical protein U9O97_02460, partial [Elusimicrobiota bacterium]|nr:hypothetical protein [Elusimicrobiota bacterium]